MKQQLKAALAALAEAQLELERAEASQVRHDQFLEATLSTSLLSVRYAVDAVGIMLARCRAIDAAAHPVQVTP